jgi:hypothetical protein
MTCTHIKALHQSSTTNAYMDHTHSDMLRMHAMYRHPGKAPSCTRSASKQRGERQGGHMGLHTGAHSEKLLSKDAHQGTLGANFSARMAIFSTSSSRMLNSVTVRYLRSSCTMSLLLL